jgi:hypothetical protein
MNIVDKLKTLLLKQQQKDTELSSDTLKIEDRNQVLITKDVQGSWWFLGIYSNRFKDLDEEILSEESHKEYIQWLKDTGFKPVITAYHLPRAKDAGFWAKVFDALESDPVSLQRVVDGFYKPMAFAKVERVIYANSFTFVLAKFLPGKEDIAVKLSKMKNLGMSHGFINKESNGNIFNKYRTFEMSILRSVRAANPFTLSGVLSQRGNDMDVKDNQKALTPEDRSALVDLFGEEVIGKIESRTEKAEEVLTRLIEYKLVGDVEKAKKPMTPAQDDAEDAADGGDDESAEGEKPVKPKKNKEDESVEGLTLDIVAKALTDSFTSLEPVLAEMQQKIEAAEKRIVELTKQLNDNAETVKEIKKSDDQKIAETWLPHFNFRAGYSAAEAKDNLVEDDKEKKDLTNSGPAGSQKKVQNSVMLQALPLFTKNVQG